MEENGNLERIEQGYIAINFLEKTDRKKDFAIDVTGIVTLEDFIREQNKKQKEDNQEKTEIPEMKTSGAYVIPITFSNGDSMNLVVSGEGVEFAGVYTDKEGNVTNIQLSSEIQKNILRELNGIEGKVDANMIMAALTPSALEELQRSITEENLIPRSQEEFAERVNSKYPNIVKASTDREMSQEEKEKEEKRTEESIAAVPEEIRDKIAKLCSENDLDINLLKEVMEVPPHEINNHIENSGVQRDGANVLCLRFGNKSFDANGKDRIVMIQDGQQPLDERQYDEVMTDYMIEHRGENPAVEKSHKHMIIYTDIDGNTTAQELHKEPRDLTYEQKELIQKELEQLQNASNDVKNNPNISKEDKERLFKQINDKIKAVFEKYGIHPNLVMDEMEADQDTLEESIDDKEEEPKKTGPKNEEHVFPSRGERGEFFFGNHRLF